MLSRTLFVLFLYTYFIRPFLPSALFIVYLPYILIWLYTYTRNGLNDIYMALIIFVFITSSIILDIDSGLSISFILIGIHTPYLFSKHFRLDLDVFYRVYFYILIPCFFLNYFFISDRGIGNALTYIPLPSSDYKINVLTRGGTVHGTSVLGIFLLIISAYKFYYTNSRKKTDVFFLVLSLYFVLFSGSRSGYIGLLFVFVFIAINRKAMHKLVTSLFFFLLIVLMYSIEIIATYISFDSPLLNSFMKFDNIDKGSGITSGRSWLWGEHISLFLNSDYYLGQGKYGFHFSIEEGDFAGGESPATDILARYGLFGLSINLFFFYLFFYALKRNNIFGALLIGTNILIYLGGTGYFFPPDVWNFPLFCLYFFSFRNDLFTPVDSIYYKSTRKKLY